MTIDTLPIAVHANLQFVTPTLAVGGDLDGYDAELTALQITELERLGITHVIDCRLEWNDEALFGEHLPTIAYLHHGMDPPPDILDRYVWQPVAEVAVREVFAFGAPWLDICTGLGWPLLERFGPQHEQVPGIDASWWNLAVFGMPSGQRVIVSWQPGYAGPPGMTRIEPLRRLLSDGASNVQTLLHVQLKPLTAELRHHRVEVSARARLTFIAVVPVGVIHALRRWEV